MGSAAAVLAEWHHFVQSPEMLHVMIRRWYKIHISHCSNIVYTLL